MSGTSLFQKATRRKQKARIAATGPAKSGKTTLALSLARGIVGPSGRIAVIDTEHGSASKTCAGDFDFDVIEIDNYDPRIYLDIIQSAEREKYDAIVIDSYSHAWMGKGGVLEIVDNTASRSRSGNTFTAFKEATPIHQSLIEGINASPCHIIATMRAKTEYVLERDPNTGKTAPRKLGLAAVQRDGVEYEFDILMRVDQDHTLVVEGSRYKAIDGLVLRRDGWMELGQKIGRWLDEGDDMPVVSQPQDSPGVARLKHLVAVAGMSETAIRTALSKRSAANYSQLTHAQVEEMISNLEVHLNNQKFVDTFPHVETAREEAEEQKRLRAERDTVSREVTETAQEHVTA